MTDEERPPESFLIPIPSLRVPRPWPVGRTVIHPGTNWEKLLETTPPYDTDGDFLRDRVAQTLKSADNGSIGELRGIEEIDDALDAVRSSLDALRLFQLSRLRTQATSFGLPGDLYQSRIEYVATWERSAPGWRFRGVHKGWQFDEAAADDWDASAAFQFLSDALRDPTANEGAQRAAIGTQLFSRAAMEHRQDLKMLGLAAALEAWLLRRQPGAQSKRLARHVSWFGCGQHDGNLCGRARPICPYLWLSPDSSRDRHRLDTLRALGNSHVTWRRSEWHRVMDWYDSRSGAAHGDPSSVDKEEASSAEYWIAHYLAEPILLWLKAHAADPVEALEREIESVTEPKRWQEMLDALDASDPPTSPPID